MMRTDIQGEKITESKMDRCMLTRPANLDDRICQGKVEKKRLHKTINVVLNKVV